MSEKRPISDADRECPVVENDPLWEESMEAWDDRVDFRSGEEAHEIFLEMAEEDRRNPDLAAWVVRSGFYVGDYEPEKKKATQALQRAIEVGSKSSKHNVQHVPVNFWTACCIGKYVERAGLIKAALHAPDVAKCLRRVYDLEPRYYYCGLGRYIALSLPRAPKATTSMINLLSNGEFSNERLIGELEEELAGGPMFVLSVQALAECYWHLDRREKMPEARALLKEAEGRLDESPIMAPENHLDLPRAQEALEKMR